MFVSPNPVQSKRPAYPAPSIKTAASALTRVGASLILLAACSVSTTCGDSSPAHTDHSAHSHKHHGGHHDRGAAPETESVDLSAAPAGKLSVLDARVRSVPPGVRISAAYMQIANRTDQDDRLTACRYTGAGKVEIHETLVDAEGVMRMRPMQDGLKIPAGAGAALRPGGAHLMLINLNVEPRAGQTIQLECDFAAAGTRSIAARVFEGE